MNRYFYTLRIIGTETDEVIYAHPDSKLVVYRHLAFPFKYIRGYAISHENFEAEIFPGIYIKTEKKRGSFKDFLHDIRRREIVITKQNNIDNFEVIDEQEAVLREDKLNGTRIKKYIDINNVLFPASLGGGLCGGCEVYSHFTSLYLGNYPVMMEIESNMMESTVGDPHFTEICYRSKCYETYRSICENGYSTDLRDGLMIQISEYNDISYAGEGKHRVCALKRFGYSKPVYARVYKTNSDYLKHIRVCNYFPSDSEVDDYYKVLSYWNIDRKTAQKCLIAGERALKEQLMKRYEIYTKEKK